jgi:hypothetical protein
MFAVCCFQLFPTGLLVVNGFMVPKKTPTQQKHKCFLSDPAAMASLVLIHWLRCLRACTRQTARYIIVDRIFGL